MRRHFFKPANTHKRQGRGSSCPPCTSRGLRLFFAFLLLTFTAECRNTRRFYKCDDKHVSSKQKKNLRVGRGLLLFIQHKPRFFYFCFLLRSAWNYDAYLCVTAITHRRNQKRNVKFASGPRLDVFSCTSRGLFFCLLLRSAGEPGLIYRHDDQHASSKQKEETKHLPSRSLLTLLHKPRLV